MAPEVSTRKTSARKTSARKASASTSSPASSPIQDHKPRSRKDHDRARSKSHPACYCCYDRRVKCSNTKFMTGFPCRACVRRGTTADCIAHKDHPNWVPGVTGATHKRKRKVKQLEQDAADEAKDGNKEKPKKKQKGPKPRAVNVEVAAPVGVEVPTTNKSSKRKANALEPKDEDEASMGNDQEPKKKRLRKDKTVDEVATSAAPLPGTGSPRRSLRNNIVHVANTDDGEDVQSEDGQSEDGVAQLEEMPEQGDNVDEAEPHTDQLPGVTIKPNASKLSTVQEIESSLGSAADRPEVGLVLEQMHSRYTSGSGEVPHRMHLLMARVVRHCEAAGVSAPRDQPSH
ncbi:hypothetical protein CB0940_05970 [Cercospora beticola]|uniref:Zn(2)-C6 fungal-type domain-containing protein n=1 Tax=Cercospora beticola TaxID=122368 RepID=A0A2G5HZM9_CERBT|nr:hypothetical protein CB0940_05970 [Cercospora beticola]PIA98015.1 hypothetical protein CB0940_05970 [Cercospora beticola]WPA98572.1 hypothetical protein RHO25_003184 [Cercospora beticola]